MQLASGRGMWPLAPGVVLGLPYRYCRLCCAWRRNPHAGAACGVEFDRGPLSHGQSSL